MTTQSTHDRQTSMLPLGFEPTNSAGERPQNYALDRAATGIGLTVMYTVHLTVMYTVYLTVMYTVYLTVMYTVYLTVMYTVYLTTLLQPSNHK